MSYIGIKGVSRLDPDNLLGFREAEMLFRGCRDPKAIKLLTGWERGVDKLWRYEITDPFIDSVQIEDYVKLRFGESINIRSLMNDEYILKAYPEFENLTLFAMYSPRNGTVGYYNPETNGMVVSMGKPSDKFEYQIEGVLLHELQHLIQEIEGFAKGGDPKVFGRKRYFRLAGEVEARNICIRHFLSEDERKTKLRTETQDVLDSKQIIMS